MTATETVTQWIVQVKGGEQDGAQKLWERYFHRLLAVAHKKLGGASRRVVDEEDVVLSAMKSFMLRAEQGGFAKLEDRDDVWQLLVMITARKAANQVKWQYREVRGGGRVRGESYFAGVDADSQHAGIGQVMGEDPTPEFAMQVTEECQRLLDKLDDETLREIAMWKLEGYSNEEIAEKLGRNVRTVERKLGLIRKAWSQEV